MLQYPPVVRRRIVVAPAPAWCVSGYFPPIQGDFRMGKQYTKREKRVRRKKYLDRKKAEARAAMKR